MKKPFKPCSKCGANNNPGSKHAPFVKSGKNWCGYCGTKLAKENSPSQ